jgi:general secretion pathway protein B
MSYILDALKKIEHEKSRKAAPDGRISIAGDLFQERNRPTGKAGIWKIMLLVMGVSLVTGAATWFLLPGYGRKSVAVIRPAAPPAAPVNPPVVTAAPLPVQTRSVPVAAAPAIPTAAVPATPKIMDTAESEESALRDVRRSKKQIKAQPSSTYPKQTVPTVQPPADIKLSGIAWQDDRAARRVVINGFLLKEGAVVFGAKIIDIQADRVRFSSAVGLFEIRLDSVLPTEVKR